MDLVATSIASDLVHIVDENRILAKFGIDLVNKNPRPGIKALINELKLNRTLEISDLVFIIGPRINAAGRIAHGSEAVELLVAKDLEYAVTKIKKVQENNDARKGFDKDITEEAFYMIDNDENLIHKKSTVLFQPHWHKGVDWNCGFKIDRKISQTNYYPHSIKWQRCWLWTLRAWI
jgi:single-stranded-DNA-specific exonuclease